MTQIQIILFCISAILGSYITLTLIMSIKMPKAGTGQIILRLNKFHKVIANIPDYRVNSKGNKCDITKTEDDIIPLTKTYKRSFSEKSNIYFFLWPFYKTYTYPFEYTLRRTSDKLQADDAKMWHIESTNEFIVSRKALSNHFKFRTEYPTITPDLDTKEFGKIVVFTNNVVQATNFRLMAFNITDWFGFGRGAINGALRGLVSGKKIDKLNEFNSKRKTAFETEMLKINDTTKPYGFQLVTSVFEDFNGADDATKNMMASFGLVTVAKNTGDAALAQQEGETAAFIKKTDAEIKQEKKRKIDTGIARADSAGNITELVPDADVKAKTDALKELAKVTGTLVFGDGTLNMLDLKKTS